MGDGSQRCITPAHRLTHCNLFRGYQKALWASDLDYSDAAIQGPST
jgi:hypothetical protein